jgi:hypothetical protein
MVKQISKTAPRKEIIKSERPPKPDVHSQENKREEQKSQVNKNIAVPPLAS